MSGQSKQQIEQIIRNRMKNQNQGGFSKLLKTPQQSENPNQDSSNGNKKESTLSDIVFYLLLIFGLFGSGYYIYKSNSRTYGSIEVSQDSKTVYGNFQESFMGFSGIRYLITQLYGLDDLKNLNLNLATCNLQNDEIIELASNLDTFKNIENLEINLSNNFFTEQGTQKLLEKVTNMKQLKDLTLIFDGVRTLVLSNPNPFQSQLQQVAQLQSLKLTFLYLNLSGKVESVMRGVENLQNLTNLEVDFTGSSINTQGLRGIAGTISSLTNLQNLTLNLYANKLGLDGGVVLAPYLKDWKSLSKLNLDLYFNNITREGAIKLSQSLGELVNLQTLELDLDFNYIQNQGGAALGTALRKLPNIQNLEIGCAKKNFGFDGFHEVVLGITKIKKLVNLNLHCGVNRVGLEGANDLKLIFTAHPNIRNLKINFEENYVNDLGAKSIGEGLERLTGLQNLEINLVKNNLYEYGVSQLAQGLQKIKWIESLYLDISMNQINDEGAINFFKIFERIVKQVPRVELLFIETAISNKTLHQIQQQMGKYSNLKLAINSVVSQDYYKKVQQDIEESWKAHYANNTQEQNQTIQE